MLPLLLLLSATPDFAVDAGTEAERLRLANYRCATGAAHVTDGGSNFYCPQHPGIDVTDALRISELVIVASQVTSSYDEKAKLFRVRLTVERVLKGVKPGPVVHVVFPRSFPVPDPDARPAGRIRSIWLLSRHGTSNDFEAISALTQQPMPAEPYLRQLLAEAPCPAKPSGVCAAYSMCPFEDVTCKCEPACDASAPATWRCLPPECATARNEGSCSKEGLTCESRCGTAKWVCDKGHWTIR